MVKDVNSGDIWEVDLEKNTLFPYFHLSSTSVESKEMSLTYNFQLFIMDLVEPHQSNEQQVLSDTLATMLDILQVYKDGNQLENGTKFWGLEEHTLTPFSERFDNALAGWVVNIKITTEWGVCQVEEAFDEPNESCIQ